METVPRRFFRIQSMKVEVESSESLACLSCTSFVTLFLFTLISQGGCVGFPLQK